MCGKTGSRMTLTHYIDTVAGWRSILSPPLSLVIYRACVHSSLSIWGAAGNGVTCLNGSLSAFTTSHRATPAESDLKK